jgi:hypothetical protein
MAEVVMGANTIVQNQGMSFGIVRYALPNVDVMMSDTAVITFNPSADTFLVSSGTKRVARVTVMGNPNETITVSFINGNLTGQCGSLQLSNISTTNNVTTYTLNSAGSVTFNIKANYNIPNNACNGLYQGTFEIKVYYQSQAVTVQQNISANTTLSANTGNTTEVSPISFGVVYRSINDSCTINLSLTGAVSGNCDATGSNGIFQANLVSLTTSNISMPTVVNLTNGKGNTLQITNMVYSLSQSGTSFGLNIYNIKIGGTLNVPSGSPVGTYNGTYTIILNY